MEKVKLFGKITIIAILVVLIVAVWLDAIIFANDYTTELQLAYLPLRIICSILTSCILISFIYSIAKNKRN